jgi:hypothetical protein
MGYKKQRVVQQGDVVGGLAQSWKIKQICMPIDLEAKYRSGKHFSYFHILVF